ncbi:metallopeptidase TldD-related protein [Bacillus smithii]|uniref:metallopeptidase TldD-related protein n=1 Tax=Bacillus smithii TaxID=1479 RepID=UPI002E1A5B56|nr:metallopeptidase TldD-related protein [Bacillus smithii]
MKYKFYEEHHWDEEINIETISNGTIKEIQYKKFHNHAVRVINQNNKMGFYISTGDFDKDASFKAADINAYLPTNVPSENNHFVANIDIYEDTSEKQSIELIREKLLDTFNFEKIDYVLTLEESKQHKSISNSYGVKGSWELKCLDISVEFRHKTTKRLLAIRRFHIKSYSNLIRIYEQLSSLPILSNSILYNFNGPFILSPNVVMEYLFPIQNLILQSICVTEKINHNLTIKETNKGIYQIPFDDEGVIPTEKIIYQEGIYRNPIFSDLSDEVSTGNGLKIDYRRLPRVSPLVWEINPGNQELQNFIKHSERAILIDTVVQSRIDKFSGCMISNVITSYLIENGEISGILPDFNIIVDPVCLFEHEHLIVCKETEFTDNHFYKLPYIITDQVYIIGR